MISFPCQYQKKINRMARYKSQLHLTVLTELPSYTEILFHRETMANERLYTREICPFIMIMDQPFCWSKKEWLERERSLTQTPSQVTITFINLKKLGHTEPTIVMELQVTFPYKPRDMRGPTKANNKLSPKINFLTQEPPTSTCLRGPPQRQIFKLKTL